MIRNYTESDLEAVADLLRRNKHRTVYFDEDGCVNYFGSRLAGLAALDEALVAVSETNGNIEGIIVAMAYPQLWSSTSVVARDILFICEGRGLSLLRHYIKWAKSKGATRILTHCSSGNPRTEELYHRLGYSRLGSFWEIDYG